jgi:hypothetical protein
MLLPAAVMILGLLLPVGGRFFIIYSSSIYSSILGILPHHDATAALALQKQQ